MSFRAIVGKETVGMVHWMLCGDVAYYHLAAYNATGYEKRVSFGLFWLSYEYFSQAGFRWINLGAGAGLHNDGTDGLSRFKRGWSNTTRWAYFCGRIIDHARYTELSNLRGPHSSYFPAYRF
jgi:hypothetical protein